MKHRILTRSDSRELGKLPEGWFSIDQVSVTVNRPRWRCDRLTALGALKSKIVRTPIKLNSVEIGHHFLTKKYRKTNTTHAFVFKQP